MKKQIHKRIDDLNKKLAELKAQKLQADARERARHLNQKRKNDTRQKILLGSFLLAQIPVDRLSQFCLGNKSLDSWLTRPADRALFGLPNSEVPE
jgi:hypothetical protein